MTPAAPTRRPRRILLAVAGLSPQVVTETVYAMARSERAALPTEIHVLTTAEGAERARLTLLGRTPGWFGRLARERRLPRIAFPASHIHVVTDRRGRPLADIRTPTENDCLADQVTEMVRRFTADAGAQLHVSLAGGRKTMGFYAGYALSLYGRAQDRLSHVLVSPPFESHPDFFFPSARPRTIYDRDRRPLDASAAEVTLAEIPFVRMRERLSEKLVRGRASFSATVQALNQAQGPLRLVLDLDDRRVRADAAQCALPPREMALLALLARRCAAAQPGPQCPQDPDAALAQEYLACYAQVQRQLAPRTTTHQRLAGGMPPAFFTETKARLNAALVRAGLREAYLVQRVLRPQHPAEFALTLPPNAISFASLPETSR